MIKLFRDKHEAVLVCLVQRKECGALEYPRCDFMEMSKASSPLVILNPAANRGDMRLYRTLLGSHLKQEQAEYVETSRQGEAQDRAMDAAKEGRPIIVVGGDGSIHEVVNGLLAVGQRVPLGIIAAGSGNDFAWNTLKLPRDPTAAIERAFNGQLVDVDAGIVNGRYFANSFSIGLDADIAVRAGHLKKFPLMSGARLYYTSTLWQLFFGYHRCPRLKFHFDSGQEAERPEKRYVLLAVTNGPAYGAGFRINPTANHTDGLFDVCTIDYTPLLRALQILPIVQRGEHAACPEVTFYRTKSLHIESERVVNVQMDGETMSATSLDAKVLPGALWVRV